MVARLTAGTAALACAALASCSPPSSLRDGDCGALLRLHGDTYGSAVGMQIPRRGERLATTEYGDCVGDPVPDSSAVAVFSVPGHDPGRLVLAAEENGDAVYMNTTIPWRDRPRLVKDSARYVECLGPAKFTGAWPYVDPEDMPNGEDYDSAHAPYTGVFNAWKGTGVHLDRWARVTLQAEITGNTQPVPSARFLERATHRNVPVTVTTTCRGNSFQVETIRFAR